VLIWLVMLAVALSTKRHCPPFLSCPSGISPPLAILLFVLTALGSSLFRLQLLDDMMGRWVEDITQSACDVARARASAAAAHAEESGSASASSGHDAPTMLQVSDVQAVVTDAYPYLAAPTASIAAGMAARPPPSSVYSMYLSRASTTTASAHGLGATAATGAGLGAAHAAAAARGSSDAFDSISATAAAAATRAGAASGTGVGGSKAERSRAGGGTGGSGGSERSGGLPAFENGIPLIPTASREAVERALQEMQGSANAGLPLAGTSYIQIIGPNGEVMLKKRRGRPPTAPGATSSGDVFYSERPEKKHSSGGGSGSGAARDRAGASGGERAGAAASGGQGGGGLGYAAPAHAAPAPAPTIVLSSSGSSGGPKLRLNLGGPK
jgi:hypothetical protein